MRYRVPLREEARAQLRDLAPAPKRDVRRTLRALEKDPYGPGTKQLERQEVLYRVRVGDYRIIFEPGPGRREVTVTKIAHRSVAYEGLER